MAKHGPVTKADLKGFDRQSTDLILWAQDQGATVRISRRGHAIIMAPNGGTTAISRKTNQNRNHQNGQAAIKRLVPMNERNRNHGREGLRNDQRRERRVREG